MQAARYDQMVGTSVIWGNRLGLFSVDTAVNRLDTGQLGGSTRIQYRYASDTNTTYTARTFDLSVEYDSAHFLPLSAFGNRSVFRSTSPLGPGEVLPVNFDLSTVNNRSPQALLVAGSLTQPLTRKLAIEINGNYSRNRDKQGDTGSVSAIVTYQAPYHTTIGLGLTYQWVPRENPDNLISGRGISFLLTLTHQFGRHASASGNADRFQQRASFTRSASRQVDDYYVNADVSHSQFGSFGNALVGYETNRGDIQGLYSSSLDENGHVSGQQGGVLFSGSVAMADGHFGLGRQITDSFAVVRKDPSLGDRQLLIQNRTADEPVARSGFFGPAVVPLSSYTPTVVPYDIKDLPPGYDLGDGNFGLYPWRHSGSAFKVGSPYHMSALGNLVDGEGSPLALRTGTAVSLTDPHAPRVEVISNRAGHFAALGLAPGRYRITISGDASLVYEMTITQKPEMFERVGTLHPSTVGR
jgi:outer membrane usher protein